MTVMRVTLVAVLAAFLPATLHAQDTPKIGLVMGYPPSIGVLWQVSSALALRPEINLSHVSTESRGGDLSGTSSPVTTDQTTGVGVGISALFYFAGRDSLRPFISPRFVYSRTSASASTNNNTILGPSTSESTTSAYGMGGSFGAQYALGRRIGVFGEVGVSYSRVNIAQTSIFNTIFTSIFNGVVTQTARQQSIQSSSSSNTVGTRTAVGVIFFF